MVTKTVSDFKALDFVENNDLAYRCTLRLGHCKSWKQFRSGKLERTPEEDKRDGDGVVTHRAFTPQFASHEVGPISAKTLNGLIGSHNQFLKERANPYRLIEGAGGTQTQVPKAAATLNRAILVSNIKPTDEPLTDATVQERTARLEKLLERIAVALEGGP